MMHRSSLLLLVASATSGVSALTLSKSCETGLLRIATDPANTCLGLTRLIPAVVQPNISIVSSVDRWLESTCLQPKCTNETLANLVSSFISACASDFSIPNPPSNATIAAIQSKAQAYYPGLRDIACLTDSGVNCVTQTLTNAQNLLGNPIALNNASTVIFSGLATGTFTANITCTNCTKAAYNIVQQDAPVLGSSRLVQTFAATCPASFKDGETPVSIVESAKPDASAGMLAVRRPSGALTAGMLLGVAALVVLL
ncbi:hypothetical protein MIND_01378600 [Mycena indigotica]|uniref:Uncharacterized protein n=1 Tax=Mycena indigotica TaxID=2126181 RepID=A0A8H6RWP5_9AGAR|nr:uncharacterized protein MIND_01378600 [Mycena indigotica]KAF7289175.1 hypothetical protein MIND_01378600 [Mycena indigotica]